MWERERERERERDFVPIDTVGSNGNIEVLVDFAQVGHTFWGVWFIQFGSITWVEVFIYLF